MMSTHLAASIRKLNKLLVSISHKPPFTQIHYHSHQLPSPISPSTQPSPPTSPPGFALMQTSNTTATLSTQQSTNLVPIKGFVHEVLCKSCTSGSVLQTALCYLEAIHAKVPELVQKERNGEGVHSELDLNRQIIQGDLEAKWWQELALDSVMANFILLEAQQSTNPMPIKGFVHKVLCRSHTPGSVLQTALCYLEGIHTKVPELVQKEKNGEGVHSELDLNRQIIQEDLEVKGW